jgi:hypothetical protein
MSSDLGTVAIEDGNIERRLDLSESRAYDCALEILAGLKLTGSFHINLNRPQGSQRLRQGYVRGRAEIAAALFPRLPWRCVPAQCERAHGRVRRDHAVAGRTHRVRGHAILVGQGVSLAGATSRRCRHVSTSDVPVAFIPCL